MALIEADRGYPQEARYWRMVQDTLVEVFGTATAQAETLVRDLIRRMADASPEERLLSFHNEPLEIAASLLDPAHGLSEAEQLRYMQLARAAGWGHPHPASLTGSSLTGSPSLAAPPSLAGSRTAGNTALRA